MVVLLLTLFTMTSVAAFAYGQSIQSPQSQNTPSGGGVGITPAGTADLQWNPQTNALTAIVHLSGLQPDSSYANHIHTGNCTPGGEAEGKMLYPFNNVVTDATGNGTATTTVNNVTGGIPASGWHIVVHNGPTAEASPLLCGNVVNPTGATAVSVLLSLVDPMR
jgi:hypothetical protein